MKHANKERRGKISLFIVLIFLAAALNSVNLAYAQEGIPDDADPVQQLANNPAMASQLPPSEVADIIKANPQLAASLAEGDIMRAVEADASVLDRIDNIQAARLVRYDAKSTLVFMDDGKLASVINSDVSLIGMDVVKRNFESRVTQNIALANSNPSVMEAWLKEYGTNMDEGVQLEKFENGVIKTKGASTSEAELSVLKSREAKIYSDGRIELYPDDKEKSLAFAGKLEIDSNGRMVIKPTILYLGQYKTNINSHGLGEITINDGMIAFDDAGNFYISPAQGRSDVHAEFGRYAFDGKHIDYSPGAQTFTFRGNLQAYADDERKVEQFSIMGLHREEYEIKESTLTYASCGSKPNCVEAAISKLERGQKEASYSFKNVKDRILFNQYAGESDMQYNVKEVNIPRIDSDGIVKFEVLIYNKRGSAYDSGVNILQENAKPTKMGKFGEEGKQAFGYMRNYLPEKITTVFDFNDKSGKSIPVTYTFHRGGSSEIEGAKTGRVFTQAMAFMESATGGNIQRQGMSKQIMEKVGVPTIIYPQKYFNIEEPGRLSLLDAYLSAGAEPDAIDYSSLDKLREQEKTEFQNARQFKRSDEDKTIWRTVPSSTLDLSLESYAAIPKDLRPSRLDILTVSLNEGLNTQLEQYTTPPQELDSYNVLGLDDLSDKKVQKWKEKGLVPSDFTLPKNYGSTTNEAGMPAMLFRLDHKQAANAASARIKQAYGLAYNDFVQAAGKQPTKFEMDYWAYYYYNKGYDRVTSDARVDLQKSRGYVPGDCGGTAVVTSARCNALRVANSIKVAQTGQKKDCPVVVC